MALIVQMLISLLLIGFLVVNAQDPVNHVKVWLLLQYFSHIKGQEKTLFYVFLCFYIVGRQKFGQGQSCTV